MGKTAQPSLLLPRKAETTLSSTPSDITQGEISCSPRSQQVLAIHVQNTKYSNIKLGNKACAQTLVFTVVITIVFTQRLQNTFVTWVGPRGRLLAGAAVHTILCRHTLLLENTGRIAGRMCSWFPLAPPQRRCVLYCSPSCTETTISAMLSVCPSPSRIAVTYLYLLCPGHIATKGSLLTS